MIKAIKIAPALRSRLAFWIYQKAVRNVMFKRKPDFVIGRPAYLKRWFILPRNPLFNIYLHRVDRSDDDAALHDHPWFNCSILLAGEYLEHEIRAGGVHMITLRKTGSIVLRSARAAHRLEILPNGRAVSLFITGPRLRQWGFHCPEAGWRHWRDFTAGPNGETIGKGCE